MRETDLDVDTFLERQPTCRRPAPQALSARPGEAEPALLGTQFRTLTRSTPITGLCP